MDITNGSFKYKDILGKTQMNKKSLMRLEKIPVNLFTK